MDLFETLGSAIIGDIDTARERADTRAIEAEQDDLHDPELKDYGVTIELTLASYSEKEAVLLDFFCVCVTVLPAIIRQW